MPLAYYAVKTRTGERLARLPLTPEGDFGTTIATFSTATFTLDLDDVECPEDWASCIEKELMSIAVVEEYDDGTSAPIWMGRINDTPISSGSVKIACASLEAYLASRRAKDASFGLTSDYMAIPRELIRQVEAGGIGIGLAVDAPDCGTARAMTLKESDAQSVAQVLDEIGLEWTIALSWADATQSVIVKTFTAREPFLGTIVNDYPEHVFTAPGNVNTWTFNAPTTEGKTATYIVAEGAGTGDLRTTSLPEIDTDREAAGYPRVEYYRNVQGVVNVNDANVYAKQIAGDMFARKQIITLGVDNTGDTSLRNVPIGSTVRIMIDAPELQLDEVWRYVGWTMAPSGETWAPTLAKLGTKVKDFPRAINPSDQARAIRDIGINLGTVTGRDPLINGYTFPPLPDGSSFAIDPAKGFGSIDSSGVFTAMSGGSGTVPWNPGSGTVADPGATWGFGSEGTDPGGTPSFASQFTMSVPYFANNSAAIKPRCQNEGNLVFNHSGNDKAYTSKSYNTNETAPPADDYGYLDIYTGYLQHGQLAEWALRSSVALTPDIIGPLLSGSSAATRPSPSIFNGTPNPYYCTGVHLDFTGQPFATGGYLYIPVSVAVTWTASGGAYPASSQALRFLRIKVLDFKTLGALEVVTNADIPNANAGNQLKTERAGTQILLATPTGSNNSIIYGGQFDGSTGDVTAEGFWVIPTTDLTPDVTDFVIAKNMVDTTGMSLYSAAGELQLMDGNLKPRNADTVWVKPPALDQYMAATASFGRVVAINVDGSVSAPVVGVSMLDATGFQAVGTATTGALDTPAVSFSYQGYVYGFSYSYDYSALLTPKPATP